MLDSFRDLMSDVPQISSSDRAKNGFTIFIRGDSKDALDFVDKMLVLLQVRERRLLILMIP